MIVWSSPIFGETIHAQRRYQEAIEERARRLEAERNERARLAAQEERSRIFRELHDIWAHTIRPTSCRDGHFLALRAPRTIRGTRHIRSGGDPWI